MDTQKLMLPFHAVVLATMRHTRTRRDIGLDVIRAL